ncbi:MGH1-like glycoside hydrolase domain-containing protein [Rhizobium tubonense]|uniref:mannosyl-oligosaccharide glucosidase n=1 Tax=Rhizobium tubonense TaxID=484088 RepID=A0A2W4EQP0_9HYPH|nr:glucosidase [Rhizobium tubonense]PZM15756.1 glucosidase [Rhizobium tubonense]
MDAETQRLLEAREKTAEWKKWGPYLSERQWGTVREDYSDDGNAWDHFTHDQARSRAYRWGEDGLAGISDREQRLCFALALWNGQDPILKERLFGLTNSEGNHGEDVKEYYFYLDSTPTHSFMKYLYKYPQAAFPYDDLVATNRLRGRTDPEYELLDTGVFSEDRYFDVFVEYAKAAPEDILIEIALTNRGPEAATLQVLPTLWFRDAWSAGEKPRLQCSAKKQSSNVVTANWNARSGPTTTYLCCDGAPKLLFTENETNTERLYGVPNRTQFAKDGINDYVVNGRLEAVNSQQSGTKVAAQYVVTVRAGETRTIRLRLSDVRPTVPSKSKDSDGVFGRSFDETMRARRDEADEFYASITPPSMTADAAIVMRQALAGMMWSKQFYFYDLNEWLAEHGAGAFTSKRRIAQRNDGWHHMHNADIISMPDKWEYPWYAAWDLAFHIVALTMVDPDFGKEQLDLMLRSTYMHPNGQIPAYEWNFGDVNPPVHAWATIFTYRLEEARTGKGDVAWLQRCFEKLLLNFTWWVNRKDRSGKNVFEGGFLGLDNIGLFDRSSPLPTGGYLEQADGTAWMALYCQNMMEIAAELAMRDGGGEEMMLKFTQHFLLIASAMTHAGEEVGMWDEEDGFFYDVLRLPDGHAQRLKVRSIVGLLPLCAATVFEGNLYEKFPDVPEQVIRYLNARPELTAFIHDPRKTGYAGRRLASILDEEKLRQVLSKMLDENEFLSRYGIRALSRYHEKHPYVFNVGDQEYRVSYLPSESDSGMFGGNSNWRGPIWMPMNGLMIRALLQYYMYYGNDFTVECPTGSGRHMNLYQVAEEITRRLSTIFLRGPDGKRPVFGGADKFQEDPHWRDCLQFYEYFHGDNGAGLGANHQTGWTGFIARGMHVFASGTAKQWLQGGKWS